MQSLIAAVRSTGATQPVMAGGLFDANDRSGWLAHRPTDPANQLVASFHAYQGETCADAGCWDAEVLPVARRSLSSPASSAKATTRRTVPLTSSTAT